MAVMGLENRSSPAASNARTVVKAPKIGTSRLDWIADLVEAVRARFEPHLQQLLKALLTTKAVANNVQFTTRIGLS